MSTFLSYLGRDDRLLLDLASGVFIGLGAAFLALFVVCRNSIALTLFRFALLALTIGVASLFSLPWIRVVLSTPAIFGYLPNWGHQAFWIGIPIVTVFVFQYVVSVRFLDSKFRLRIKPLDPSKSTELKNALKTAQNEGRVLPPVSLAEIDRALLASTQTALSAPLTYGGWLLRPRIVFPEKILPQIPLDLVPPLLLTELVEIERKGGVFGAIASAFAITPYGRLSRRAARAAAAPRVQPEWLVHAEASLHVPGIVFPTSYSEQKQSARKYAGAT